MENNTLDLYSKKDESWREIFSTTRLSRTSQKHGFIDLMRVYRPRTYSKTIMMSVYQKTITVYYTCTIIDNMIILCSPKRMIAVTLLSHDRAASFVINLTTLDIDNL